MLELIQVTGEIQEFVEIYRAIEQKSTPISVSGAADIHKAHITAAVYRRTRSPVVLVCSDEGEAERLGKDISAFTGEGVHILRGREFTFYQAEGVSRQIEQEKIGVLYAMAKEQAPIVVATAQALMQRCIPAKALLGAADTVAMGQNLQTEVLAEKLVRAGYRRCQQVEGPGQFTQRGGIMDFFSPGEGSPVRCEFWGDEIDSMSYFDAATQRRTSSIDRAVILPTAETLITLHPEGEAGFLQAMEELIRRAERRKEPYQKLLTTLRSDMDRVRDGVGLSSADKYMELIYSEFTTPIEYFYGDCTVLISEPAKLKDKGKSYTHRHREDIQMVLESGAMDPTLAKLIRPMADIFSQLIDRRAIVMENFSISKGFHYTPRTLINLTAKQLPSYGGSLETAESDISHYIQSGYRTIILCGQERRARLMEDRLKEAGMNVSLNISEGGLPEPGAAAVSLGSLSAGIEYPGARLAVITEGQIVRMPQTAPKKAKKSKGQKALESYSDLSPGDLVVHEHHGIGRFVGIQTMVIDGVKKDYIKIAYRGTDSLYVPATQLDLVSKYIGGGEDRQVRLSKMGGADWSRVRKKAKGAAKDMAKELIELYAERKRRRGFSFSPDSSWQREFEEAFEYCETEDQLTSAREIKQDMESAIPMDRLLCGDVGYGKTEVALRAVMKCVLDGKQAAILVPTTVLAQQHYSTAIRRFSGYPVRIEVLSRFKTAQETKKIIAAISKGNVDIIIGTHKILQKSIEFKDLGLLIVDEEQRFGVSHKERLKEMSKDVDVLTLSATPIPRTLNMALSGIRDMSTIEEPPQNRYPVQTYVLEHDWGVVADAIRRELDRDGQVYYLHNRVESIERTAAKIRELSGGARVAVAYGQMEERLLSRVMDDMIRGESQILVCTTIIETGIDIPNVNTLIIEDADRMGLAQLHQIRGRVGRSNRSAFAYLTYRQGRQLSEIATKRLSAIREFAEFNSGFKIALRDLEIRGAGNLLGAEQSGHMMSVGYDMYLKLLNEAVLEEKGEVAPVRADCAADLSVEANIPEIYISSPEQRMDMYRRIAQIREDEDSEDVIDELLDRYGDPPKSVMALIQVALLRGKASNAGISEISQKGGDLIFTFSTFEMERISGVYERPDFKGRIKIQAGDTPAIKMKLGGGKSVIDEAIELVSAYGESVNKS